MQVLVVTQTCHTNTHTHPLSDTVTWTIMDDLDFLPENAVLAPVPDLGTSLDCKHQQDDEGNKHQEAQDNCYCLQEPQNATSVD